MPFGDRRFDFGVNMAWINCANGHDLGKNPYFSGPSPHPDWGVSWSEDYVRAYFSDIASKGFKVVRVWAFEKLEGLQFDPSGFDPIQIVNQVSSRDGQTVITENSNNYARWNRPNVIGLDSDFSANVERLMELAVDENLEIYWTILSGGNYFKKPNGHHQWALKRMLNIPTYRSRFIQNALRPFLEILRPFQNNVYAIDLINEPEGFSWFMLPLIFYWPIIARNSLESFALDYIIDASDEIRTNFSEFKISVGFRSRSTIEDNLSILNSKLDFFDFHHYDTSEIDENPFFDKPTILGEIGYMSLLGSFSPNNSEQGIAVDGIIGDAITRGFRGCLVWMYTPKGSSVDANNLLTENGNNPCEESSRAAFLSSFNSDPDRHWRRQVREAIARHRVEVDRLNGGGP